MLKKNKFKLISIFAIFSITYDLTKAYSQSMSFSFWYSLVTGIVLGSIIGCIFDYKSNKRQEIRDLNKNIKELNKFNTNITSKEDVISKLERLNNLRKDNSISEEEYLYLKKELLKK